MADDPPLLRAKYLKRGEPDGHRLRPHELRGYADVLTNVADHLATMHHRNSPGIVWVLRDVERLRVMAARLRVEAKRAEMMAHG